MSKKEAIRYNNSDLSFKDLHNTFLQLGYVKIYFNDNLIYDDTQDELLDNTQYYMKNIVERFSVEIVSFHHSVIHIYGYGD